jgi:hypothetical protein
MEISLQLTLNKNETGFVVASPNKASLPTKLLSAHQRVLHPRFPSFSLISSSRTLKPPNSRAEMSNFEGHTPNMKLEGAKEINKYEIKILSGNQMNGSQPKTHSMEVLAAGSHNQT